MELQKLNQLIKFHPTFKEVDILYDLFKSYDIQDVFPTIKRLVDIYNLDLYLSQFNNPEVKNFLSSSIYKPLIFYNPKHDLNYKYNIFEMINIYDCIVDDIRYSKTLNNKYHNDIRVYIDNWLKSQRSPAVLGRSIIFPDKDYQDLVMSYYEYLMDLIECYLKKDQSKLRKYT